MYKNSKIFKIVNNRRNIIYGKINENKYNFNKAVDYLIKIMFIVYYVIVLCQNIKYIFPSHNYVFVRYT
jgi:hypothetical protein